jgi:hypothetical protein
MNDVPNDAALLTLLLEGLLGMVEAVLRNPTDMNRWEDLEGQAAVYREEFPERPLEAVADDLAWLLLTAQDPQ